MHAIKRNGAAMFYYIVSYVGPYDDFVYALKKEKIT